MRGVAIQLKEAECTPLSTTLLRTNTHTTTTIIASRSCRHTRFKASAAPFSLAAASSPFIIGRYGVFLCPKSGIVTSTMRHCFSSLQCIIFDRGRDMSMRCITAFSLLLAARSPHRLQFWSASAPSPLRGVTILQTTVECPPLSTMPRSTVTTTTYLASHSRKHTRFKHPPPPLFSQSNTMPLLTNVTVSSTAQKRGESKIVDPRHY